MKRLFILAIAISTLVSCQSTKNTATSSKKAVDISTEFIEANQWVLSSYQQTNPADAGFTAQLPTITINMETGNIGGNSGCNSFGGSCTIDGQTITTGQVMATKMYCPNVPENEFLELIQQALQFEIVDNTLKLSKEGSVVLEFVKK